MNRNPSSLAVARTLADPGPAEASSWSGTQAILWAAGSVVAFHLAYLITALSPLIVIFLYCVVQLSGLPTARRAFYFGLGIGYAVYAPYLTFFWTIFGWPALALWTVLAFWLGLFVALARLCRLKLGRLAILLIPFAWTGLEYFRSELYYLRFSWLSAGYAFSDAPHLFAVTRLGVYGLGFCLMAVLTGIAIQMRRRSWLAMLAFAALLAALVHVPFRSDRPATGRTVRATGLQLEYPDEPDLLSGLTNLAAQDKTSKLVVLSEYTLQGPPSNELKEWCRQNQRYLVVGGKDFVANSEFYNTVFVIDLNGEIVFRQAKSVPVQFFQDGIPARTQQLWESPWGKIGFCICYDASYQRVTDHLVRLGAQAIIIPTADESRWGRTEHVLHARIAPVRAAEYQMPIFKVACTGISQWVDRSGRPRATAPFPGQGATIAGDIEIGGPGRLPLDHWLGPLSVLVTLVMMLWHLLRRSLERFSRL